MIFVILAWIETLKDLISILNILSILFRLDHIPSEFVYYIKVGRQLNLEIFGWIKIKDRKDMKQEGTTFIFLEPVQSSPRPPKIVLITNY